MNNNVFSMPPMASEYILRSTNEKVEVVAFEQAENGARSDNDWVTYIDSEGKEHIKEPLNIQLDFKPVANDTFGKLLDIAKPNKYPTERNRRIFEVAKALYLDNDRDYSIDEAVQVATELINKVGIETE